MRILAPSTAFSLLLTLVLVGSAGAETALMALKALPKADARRLVWMEAKAGAAGEPEQWRFTVYDAKAPKQLREFIVAAGEVVTAQEVAEAPPGVSAKNVVDPGSLRIDSDAAGRAALEFAAARGFQVAAVTYELQKQGPKAVPLWAVTCLDGSGAQIGAVAITATRGSVVAQEGFAVVAPPATSALAVEPEVAARRPTGGKVDRQVVSSDQQFLTELDGASAPAAGPPPVGVPEHRKDAPQTRAAAEVTPTPAESEPPPGDVPPGDEATPRHAQRMASVDTSGDETDGARAPGTQGGTHAPAGRVERIRGPRLISPVSEVRRATAPVRHIIRRVLPF